MIYQRVTSNVKNVQDKCGIIWKINSVIEKLHILVRSFKNIDNEPGDCIFGVCRNLIIKLTNDFYTINDEENASKEKKSLFTTLKK